MRDIRLGDRIKTETKGDERWFSVVTNASKNTTVRAFARSDAFSSQLVPRLQAFGGITEKMEGSNLLAISFPPTADLAAALEYLDRESESGNLAFEESSVRYR